MKCADCKHWYCNYDLEEKPAEGEPLRCQQESTAAINSDKHIFLTKEEADAFEREAQK